MVKKCPKCGNTSVEEGDLFCSECRTRLVPKESVTPNPPHPSVGAAAPGGGALIGEGARVNVTGGISQTTRTQQDFNGAKIDVHQKEKKEFCENCGNPFGEKHARCPECGKEICFDCLLKEKNRCKKCEERAIKKYQANFQQALLESKGKLDFSLRRMMDREADELKVKDVKEDIEREALELYRSLVKAEQPEVILMATATVDAAKPQETATARGIGSLSGDAPVTPKSGGGKKDNNGGGSKWTFILFLIVVAGALYFFVGGDDESGQSSESVQQVEQPTDSQPVSKPAVKQASQPVQQVQQVSATEKQEVEPVQPAVKKDTNYEAGMKAYDAGNGLEAINAFKKSGSAKAYYMLGVIYENGCGNVDKNPMLARKNYKKAADMGNAEAKAKL